MALLDPFTFRYLILMVLKFFNKSINNDVLDISNLRSGMYFIMINNKSYKFIKL